MDTTAELLHPLVNGNGEVWLSGFTAGRIGARWSHRRKGSSRPVADGWGALQLPGSEHTLVADAVYAHAACRTGRRLAEVRLRGEAWYG